MKYLRGLVADKYLIPAINMKTFKILEKPGGILGFTFEDLGFLSLVSLVVFFFYNLLNIWFSLSGWWFMIALFVVISLFIVIKRSNKQKKPHFLLSRLAWLRTPRHFFINGKNCLKDD